MEDGRAARVRCTSVVAKRLLFLGSKQVFSYQVSEHSLVLCRRLGTELESLVTKQFFL